MLARRDAPTEKQGNIIIPTTSGAAPPMTGVVIETGAGCKWLARGDRIVFSRYAGIEWDYRGQQRLFIAEADVLARINEGEYGP